MLGQPGHLPSQSCEQGRLYLLTSLTFPLGTENLHLIFSYSVWVLRDFPEDGLKVGLRGLWVHLAPHLVLILLWRWVDGGGGRIHAISLMFRRVDWET